MKDLIEALTIFLKYGDSYHPTNCSHDELRIMDIGNVVSDGDEARLLDLGFFWCEQEGGYWLSYRFGSA